MAMTQMCQDISLYGFTAYNEHKDQFRNMDNVVFNDGAWVRHDWEGALRESHVYRSQVSVEQPHACCHQVRVSYIILNGMWTAPCLALPIAKSKCIDGGIIIFLS